MSEIEKVEVGTVVSPASISGRGEAVEVNLDSTETKGARIKSVTTSVVGNRLQISADVGADEIGALKEMLTKYEEILKLLH